MLGEQKCFHPLPLNYRPGGGGCLCVFIGVYEACCIKVLKRQGRAVYLLGPTNLTTGDRDALYTYLGVPASRQPAE